MSTPISRRDMLRTTAVAAGVWTTHGLLGRAQSKSPNEKLNIAGIGIGGRGADDVNGVAGENIVALCDVDEKRGGGRPSSDIRRPNATRISARCWTRCTRRSTPW